MRDIIKKYDAKDWEGFLETSENYEGRPFGKAGRAFLTVEPQILHVELTFGVGPEEPCHKLVDYVCIG